MVPPPMLILPYQVHPSQSNMKQSTSHMTGTDCGCSQKYLPESCPATNKGHIKKQRKGSRSTKQKVDTMLHIIETQRFMNPPKEEEKNESLVHDNGDD